MDYDQHLQTVESIYNAYSAFRLMWFYLRRYFRQLQYVLVFCFRHNPSLYGICNID